MTSQYCLKCRKKQPVSKPTLMKSKNGRSMKIYKCKTCGTKIARFAKTQEGEGLIDDARDLTKEMVQRAKSSANIIRDIGRAGLKNGIPGIRQEIKDKLKTMPASVASLLAKHGDKKIVGEIEVCRTPVQRGVQLALNAITLGAYSKAKKRLNYADVYHLYGHLTLDDGAKIEFEKNSRAVIKKVSSFKNRPGSECKSTSAPKDKTLAEFIKAGENKQGEAFWKYDARSNNCQTFIGNLLSANGIGGELTAFVKQDAKNLISKKTGRVGRALTDADATLRLVFSGGSKSRR